jgi:hypothetical protein
MTEVEWWESDALVRLLTVWGGADTLAAPRDHACQRTLTILGERATDRKLRLFAVAVCRRIAPGLLIRAAWECLEVAEKLADGNASLGELGRVREQLDEYLMNDTLYQPSEYAASAPRCCLHENVRHGVRYVVSTAWQTSQPPRDKVWASDTAARLRDVFGNPFRPVTFDAAWRTDTAVSLAQQMYESREFSPRPIRADALQDAGCDNEDILNYCRGPGPHVRGCWVVDLVLGKV